jgi:hypothetical protein
LDQPTETGASRKPAAATPAPPERAPGRRKVNQPPRITIEKYNALQAAYFKKQAVETAAKIAGVAKSTAQFYINGPARPDAGLVPIKQAWLDVQVEAQEKRQLTLVKFHEEQTKELEEIIGTTVAELKLIRAEVFRRVKRYKDSGGKDIETGASLSSALKSYESAVHLMERVLGAPDARIEHSGEDRYKTWSDEEVIEFMTTGKRPDHAR